MGVSMSVQMTVDKVDTVLLYCNIVCCVTV